MYQESQSHSITRPKAQCFPLGFLVLMASDPRHLMFLGRSQGPGRSDWVCGGHFLWSAQTYERVEPTEYSDTGSMSENKKTSGLLLVLNYGFTCFLVPNTFLPSLIRTWCLTTRKWLAWPWIPHSLNTDQYGLSSSIILSVTFIKELDYSPND